MLRADLHARAGAIEIDIELAVAQGRRLALAGPSGAGKTTILRLLAGTARAQHGRIANGEQLWLDTASGVCRPPETRRCGYVFQEYALFPHLSAWRNVAYGIRGVDRAERRTRAHAALERLGLGARAGARPAELSGGERQRVALARALATKPQALFLDEPLAALDASARAAATRELAAVLRGLEIPAILVTHDFEQAATLADEVAVLDRGRIVQRGSASELAGAPASPFVADFTGAVVLTGTATSQAGGLTHVALDGGGAVRATAQASGRVAVTVLPWEITVAPPGHTSDSSRNRLAARVVSVTRVGNRVRLALDAGQPLTAELTGEAVGELGLEPGSEVTASWKATATRLITL